MPRSNRGISAACFAAALTAAAQVSAEGLGDVGYYAAAPSKQRTSERYDEAAQDSKLSVALTVSPNPFSPSIHPIKEYSKDYESPEEVPAGTCIKVKIGAPNNFIRSLKVHIYNAEGKRVWAVYKADLDAGEYKIWWDGRTTSREEAWGNESLLERGRGKGLLCGNGRYFVTAIATDKDGRKRRAMKQIVLMK